MNDKRIKNYFRLLSCWYVSTNLKPHSQNSDGLRFMDAKYLAGQLHFKPRMIYKLTQQLLDNKEDYYSYRQHELISDDGEFGL